MMNLLPHLRKWSLLMLGAFILLTSCNPEEPEIISAPQTSSFDSDVVLKWNELLLEVERYTPGYLPPVGARSFGYIGLTAYEVAVPGMPGFKSLSKHFSGLTLPVRGSENIYYPAALNAAYASMLQKLFPTTPAAQYSRILALQNQLGQEYETKVTPEEYEASVEWGQGVAQAVFAWSQTDANGNEGYLHTDDPNYLPPAGPGLWKPTYPNYHIALLPHWGDVRTFAATSDDRCEPPLPFSTDPHSEFYVQALETENKVNLINQGQNYEDKWIAQFWSDDCAALTFSPGAHWVAIADQALELVDADLAKAVVVQAKVGMALCDAGIRCWGEKYRYNIMRPVDYIRDVMGHNTWNSIMCPDGAGLFFTPAFPTYPSGHGTFGAAAAEVLTTEFGNDFLLTDKCHQNRTEFIGTPRTFHNFYEMAQENAYSRIPIGVHFRMDAESALDLGYQVGRRVNQLPWK